MEAKLGGPQLQNSGAKRMMGQSHFTTAMTAAENIKRIQLASARPLLTWADACTIAEARR